MSRKKMLPMLAVAAPLVFKGKPVEAKKPEPVAQQPVKKWEPPVKPALPEITARQLLRGRDELPPVDPQPGELTDYEQRKALSELFHAVCTEMGVEPTERQARKARNGEGKWATPNKLTAILRKRRIAA